MNTTSDSTENIFLKDEFIENIDDGENQPQQWYAPQKQLARNCNFHDIDSSLDAENFENIIYLNTEGHFEE